MNFVCTARKEIALAPGFVDISPTLVNGTSIEKCSRVLVYYSIGSLKLKKLNLKKIEIDEIEFCLLQNVTRVSVPRRNPRIRILTCRYFDLVGQRAEIVKISARP